jgi:hypothetical protein
MLKGEKMKKLLLVGMFAVLTLTGCAGTVKRDPSITGAAPPVKVAKYKVVNVKLNEAAQKKQADNAQFSKEELSAFIKRKLDARTAIAVDATHDIEVTVTDFRVRSAFTAIMFGFMAGNDSIDGKVDVKDAAGNIINSFDVSASYALGGLAGGQDGARMNWLYEKFADLAIAEMLDQPKN